MEFIYISGVAADRPRLGNKGDRLARLALAGFEVPPFFVVQPSAFEASVAAPGARRRRWCCNEKLRREIRDAALRLCADGASVAVRSSSLEEDGKERSFAGQLASYLHVQPQDIERRVADVWRSAFDEKINAYRHFGRALGVGERAIRRNRRTYEQMIGLIQGRVYYNLFNWYRLLMLVPGFRYNSRFMEQMMGVMESLPQDTVPRAAHRQCLGGVLANAGLLRVACRLMSRLPFHGRRVRRFHQRIEAILMPVALEPMSLERLMDYYERLQAKVIRAWDTPLLNDLYCMIFHGALRKLCQRWLGASRSELHNDLICGEAGIVSLEPVRRMQAMAAIAKKDPALVRALNEATLSEIRECIARNALFGREYRSYVARFGDRCLDELKLESRTLIDDPLPMLRSLGQLAVSGNANKLCEELGALRRAAEQTVSVELGDGSLRHRVFRIVLALTRARIRDRENLRFERTRVYGRVRSIFRQAGARLQALDVLDEADDIFYLDIAEINGLVRGTGASAMVKALIRARRLEFGGYAAGKPLPRRFLTRGPAQVASSMQPIDSGGESDSGDSRRGQACSAGIVTGRVRVVTDPRTTLIAAGDILVAQQTDPGWVTVFPLASGLIMERGSLLSHAAIVARELGLPAVVGVEGVCQWLQDGDWVELDGSSGHIRLLKKADRAA